MTHPPRTPARTTARATRATRAAILGLLLTLGCGDSRRTITGPDGEGERRAVAVATLTIWTSDPAPSPIAVFVDGRSVGALTRYWTSPPPCGDATSGASITLDLPAGAHVVRAHETQGDRTWGPHAIQLEAERCTRYELRP